MSAQNQTAPEAATKSPKPSVWGVPPTSPFVFCAEQVVRQHVAPVINTILREDFANGGITLPKLAKAFSARVGHKVSTNVMRDWLHNLGYKVRMATSLVPLNDNPVVANTETQVSNTTAAAAEDVSFETPPRMGS